MAVPSYQIASLIDCVRQQYKTAQTRAPGQLLELTSIETPQVDSTAESYTKHQSRSHAKEKVQKEHAPRSRLFEPDTSELFKHALPMPFISGACSKYERGGKWAMGRQHQALITHPSHNLLQGQQVSLRKHGHSAADNVLTNDSTDVLSDITNIKQDQCRPNARPGHIASCKLPGLSQPGHVAAVLSNQRNLAAATILPLPSTKPRERSSAPTKHKRRWTHCTPLNDNTSLQDDVGLQEHIDDSDAVVDITVHKYNKKANNKHPAPGSAEADQASPRENNRFNRSPTDTKRSHSRCRAGNNKSQRRIRSTSPARDSMVYPSPRAVSFTQSKRWNDTRGPGNEAAYQCEGIKSSPAATISPPMASHNPSLPRVIAARFSTSPRFRSPSHSPAAEISPDVHNKMGNAFESECVLPSKNVTVHTKGVEAATDFVKSRHVQGVCLAPANVRSEVLGVLAERKRMRDAQRIQQRMWQRQMEDVLNAAHAAGEAADSALQAAQEDSGNNTAQSIEFLHTDVSDMPVEDTAGSQTPCPATASSCLELKQFEQQEDNNEDIQGGNPEVSQQDAPESSTLQHFQPCSATQEKLNTAAPAAIIPPGNKHTLHPPIDLETYTASVSEVARKQVDASRQLDGGDDISLPAYTRPLRRSLSVQPEDRPLLFPSFTLVEPNPHGPRFGNPSRSRSALPQRSREPGPGAYLRVDEAAMVASLSTARRAPRAVFSQTPRESIPSHRVSLQALMSYQQKDVGAAVDAVLPRAPTPSFGTASRMVMARSSRNYTTAVTVQVEGQEAVTHETNARPQVIDISYSLVEPRVRYTPVLRGPGAHPTATISDETKQAYEEQLRLQLAVDPWLVDAAIRVSKPSWTMPSAGAVVTHQRLLPPPELLYPNWDLVRPRTDTLIPLFQHLFNTRRGDGDEATIRRQAFQQGPPVGWYDVQHAWEYIQKQVKTAVLMRHGVPRLLPSKDDDTSTENQEGDVLDLDVSTAHQLVRGARAPAWPIPPPHTHHSRVRQQYTAYGPSMSLDVSKAKELLLPRRSLGVMDWSGLPGRKQAQEEKALREKQHLAPGAYNVRFELVERQPGAVRRFSDYQGHGILDSSDSDSASDNDSLPDGAVLQLDVAAARDAVLRKPWTLVQMKAMMGRDEAVMGEGASYGAYTHELSPLDPDADKLLSTRPRAPQVAIANGRDHGSPGYSDESADAAARRGPGAYDVMQQDLGVVSPRGIEFAKVTGRNQDDDTDSLEGQRLSLSPDVNCIRKRIPAAHIPALPTHHALQVEGAPTTDLYKDADYDTYNLDAVRRIPPRALAWCDMPGRDDVLTPARPSPPRDYHVEDVPITLLAGYRSPPGALDWSKMQHDGDNKLPDLDGDRLDLNLAAAWRAVQKRTPGMPELVKGLPRPNPDAGAGELTSWLSYNPNMDAIKPNTHGGPTFQQHLGRTQANAALPTQGEATGDLDGGAYNVQYTQVWARPQGITQWAADASCERFPTAPASKQEEGNALLLHPQLPKGWEKAVQQEAGKQPFGLVEGRWAGVSDVPNDDGNRLFLHTQADDMAGVNHPTLPNVPTSVFGAMTASRYEQVVKPNENAPIRQVVTPVQPQRIDTTMMMQPPSNKALDLMQKEPDHPLVSAARRRERVWSRIEARAMYEASQQATATTSPGVPAHHDAPPHHPGELHGVLPTLDHQPSNVGRHHYAAKKARLPRGLRDAAAFKELKHAHREPASPASAPGLKTIHESPGAGKAGVYSRLRVNVPKQPSK